MGKKKNDEVSDEAAGCCGCLVLLVLLIAAVAFFDPGFIDRVRGLSAQPATAVIRSSVSRASSGLSSSRPTRAPRRVVTRVPTRTPRPSRTPVPTRTPQPTPQTRYVISDRANVNARSCPRTSCAILRTLPRGSEVRVVGEIRGERAFPASNLWSRITLPGESRTVYVYSPLLGRYPPPPLAPSATARPTQPPTPRPPAPAPPQPAVPAGEQARVVWITDGDSIEVEINGQRHRVRYIGINTPERDEPCSNAAKDANARLVSGRTVTLVRDVSNTDRYGRLLRYIYVGNTFVNEVLVRDGYAENSVWAPDTRHAGHFRALEAQARAAGRGCHPTGVFADGNSER